VLDYQVTEFSSYILTAPEFEDNDVRPCDITPGTLTEKGCRSFKNNRVEEQRYRHSDEGVDGVI
jgi:hypothetical protein